MARCSREHALAVFLYKKSTPDGRGVDFLSRTSVSDNAKPFFEKNFCEEEIVFVIYIYCIFFIKFVEEDFCAGKQVVAHERVIAHGDDIYVCVCGRECLSRHIRRFCESCSFLWNKGNELVIFYSPEFIRMFRSGSNGARGGCLWVFIEKIDTRLNGFRHTEGGGGREPQNNIWLPSFVCFNPIHCMREEINIRCGTSGEFMGAQKRNFSAKLFSDFCVFGRIGGKDDASNRRGFFGGLNNPAHKRFA